MYIIYNQDGSIYKKYLNEYIQQGNSYSNVLFVAIKNITPQLYAFAKLLDDVNVQLPTSSGSMTIDGETFTGKYVTLTADATIIPGKLQLNVVAEDPITNQVLVTFNVYLMINATGLGADAPAVITTAQYLEILNQVALITGMVPYTGATQDVDLGTHKLRGASITAYDDTPLSAELTPTYIKLSDQNYDYILRLPAYYLDATIATEEEVAANYVPYTGAISDIKIGDHSFTVGVSGSGGTYQTIIDKNGVLIKTDIGSKSNLLLTYNKIQIQKLGGNIDFTFYTSGGTLITKEYVDSTKVAQTSSFDKVYGTDYEGNQTTYDVDDYPGGDGSIVRRSAQTGHIGQINIPLNPIDDTEAASKHYVDKVVSGLYKPQGSKTVAQLNNTADTGNIGTVTSSMDGFVYNVTDSGILTNGNVEVLAGDNVVIVWDSQNNTWSWDRLAGTIDWEQYNETFLAAGFIQASDIDSVPDVLTFDSQGNITNDNWTGDIDIDYMSPPISDISISEVPSTLTFDLSQDYDNMITNADWTGIMTITY